MTSSQDLPQNLQDRQNKTYGCFCDKNFTTYPGLYLHLKSKHTNVFPKYKKLKITKLLKKTKVANGCELYQLDNILEKDNNFRQKKKKQQKRMTEQQAQKPILNEEVQSIDANKNSLNQIKTPTFQYQHQKQNFGFKFQNQNPKDLLSRMGNPPFQFPFPNPFFGFPYGHNAPHPPPFFPPFFPHFTHPIPSMKAEPPIKNYLQRFLFECSGIQNKSQLKEILHDLMIYIDKNCHSIQDTKIKQKLFLSYCDEFSPKFIGPLLINFIKHEQELAYENEEQRQKILRQISYIFKFTNWLKEIGAIDQTITKDMLETEHSQVQKEPLSESENIRRISGVVGGRDDEDEE